MLDAHLRYADEGFRVVSWDQLGCGESDRPDDPSLWTVERYVDEMEIVRSALGLGRVFLVGNSWGGMLGLEYCLAHPDNVICFVCSSIAFDSREVQAGFLRCKQNLGDIGYGPLRRMFGPRPFNCTGTLRRYDRMGDLHRVTAPVLIVASEHDYVLPELCAISC